MACLTTNINTHSEQYQENYRAMASLVDQLYTVTALIEDGGGEKAREHQQKKGKLPVRERILALLDPGSSFLEIGQFAGWDVYPDYVPCAGVVAGVGVIDGTECMIVANDVTVKGGSYYPLTVKKTLTRTGNCRKMPTAVCLLSRLWRC